jgi:hypothetical protein
VTQQINLYNPAFLRRNPLLEPAALLAYAVAAVLVLMLLANVLVRQQRSQNEAMAGALDAQIKAEQEKIAALVAQRSAQKKDPVLEAEQGRLETLVRGRRASLTAIQTGAIGSTTGFSEQMRALARQSVSGLWLTGFSIGGGGSEVSLRGRMLDAGLLPRFLGKLGAEKKRLRVAASKHCQLISLHPSKLNPLPPRDRPWRWCGVLLQPIFRLKSVRVMSPRG